MNFGDWLLIIDPCLAQNSAGDAVNRMSDVQTTDPGGFTLMCICIGMLVVLVLCLFAGTMFYFLKNKKR